MEAGGLGLDHRQPKTGLQEPGWKGSPAFVSHPLRPRSCPSLLQAGVSWMSGFAFLSFPSCVKKQNFIVLPTGLQEGLTEGTGAQPTSEELETQGILWNFQCES